MYRPSLKLAVMVLALVYVAAGVLCAKLLQERQPFHVLWGLLAAFWFFLAISIWRLSRIARTVSVTLLWVVVLAGTVGALHPYYFPELEPAFDLPAVQRQPEILLVPALLSLVMLRILAKNKPEFR